MVLAVEIDLERIAQACQRYRVKRLRIFGSILTERFDEAHSDVDFLVDFLPDKMDRFDNYFGLLGALEDITGRKVDLLTTESLENPFLTNSILSTAQVIYEL
ncbi:MAG: nucleotidyltransferase domain-containing protein [Actinomycetaceae bacterium]|nr:nucleotidyltransferase domain-containing protein [Actinomycetaceae bacterium]